jgi:hypothetical protein
MQNRKRILSVNIIRECDTDPDTSYYGEYSQTATSEFSIDRTHSEDCASVSDTARQAAVKLMRVYDYLAKLEPGIESAEALYEACNIVDELQTYAQECDCGGHGDMGRHEYRYFNPSFNYVDEHGEPANGNTPEEIRKYVRQDYDRMESLNAGHWCYLGIRAEAKYIMANGKPEGVIQTLHSGGLWGIESDSDKAYLAVVAHEDLSALRTELKAIGFSTRAISAAFKDVEEIDA